MPTSSSVFAGLRFSYALPLRDSTHSPLMKFLNIRGATDVAILPPQSPNLAALLFVWSPADLNARHYRAESKFYRRISIRSNTAPANRTTAKICRFPLNPVLFPLNLTPIIRQPAFRGSLASFLLPR